MSLANLRKLDLTACVREFRAIPLVAEGTSRRFQLTSGWWTLTALTALSMGMAALWSLLSESFPLCLKAMGTLVSWGGDTAPKVAVPLVLIGFLHDQLMEMLKLSPLGYRLIATILETQQDAVVVIEPISRKTVGWNAAFRTLVGLDNEAIDGRPVPEGWADFVDLDEVETAMTALRHRGAASGEALIRVGGGARLLVAFRASWVPLNPEGVGLIILVVRDQGQQEEMTRALHENIWQHRLMMDNMPAAAWLADSAGELTYISPNIKRLCGYSDYEIMENGWPFWWKRIHSDDRALVKSAFVGLVYHQHTYELNYRFETKEGSAVWLHDKATVMADPSGDPVVYGVLSDVTHQMNLTRQLRRTENLKVVGQLAGSVVHDFNNQLTGIIGLSELIMNQTGTLSAAQEYTKQIHQCARHAEATVRRLQTLTKKESMRTVPVDLHVLVGEVADLIERTMDPRIEIVRDLRASSALVLGDPVQLQNVLMNLSLNACEAMPKGGRLTIATADAAPRRDMPRPPGQHLCLAVADTGVGMDDRIRERIFEPFFTTKPEGTGTGMGLTTVRECVRAYDGEIEVISAPAKGTAMNLYLPVHQRPDGAKLGRISVSRRRSSCPPEVAD